MALMETPICDFGSKAVDFSLLNIDGNHLDLKACRGEKGTVILFICNHCPYVKAVQTELVETANRLIEAGIAVVAIMPNDTDSYPDDSFDNMVSEAKRLGYPFPYLLDADQSVAKAYGAVCTPDYFGYNSQLELQYRGRLNATTPSRVAAPDNKAELLEAMLLIADTGKGPAQQVPSMGCSIKWRN